MVVPAYNEERLLQATLDGIPDYVDRVFVIDDDSTDATAEIAGRHPDSRLHVTRHETNRGVGASILTGYLLAQAENIDITVVMAGDNQMDPARLPELLDPVADEQADYTVGDRLSNPGFRSGMTRWRLTGNLILSFLTRIATGCPNIHDSQNGYTALSLRAMERIDLRAMYPRYGYLNDLLTRLSVAGLNIVSVAIPARYGTEKSKIRYTNYIPKVSLLMLRLFLWRMKAKWSGKTRKRPNRPAST